MRAADSHLLTGNLKKYCELKIQLGEWLEAIALAPGVSVAYWKELCNRWLAVLKEESSDLIAPLCIAANKADDLIKHYVKQNFVEKAYIVSIAASEGLLPSSTLENDDKAVDKTIDTNYYEQLIHENLRNLSERCLLSGYPVKAACWHLSNSEIQDALYCLLRGNELELAVSVCESLEFKISTYKMALKYLAWRCVQKGDWELALDILDLSADTEIEKIRICINCGLSMPERDDLYRKAGLPSVEECEKLADEELFQNGHLPKIIQYYLLSNDPKKGLDLGLKYINDLLSEPSWQLESVWQVLCTLSSVRNYLLQEISCDRHRFELQVYGAYVGALIAIRQHFYPVVVPLFSTALNLIRRVHNANLSVTEDMISSEMHAWVVSRNSEPKNPESANNIYKELMAKVLEDQPFGDIGATVVSGSNLPRHSDHHRCYLRGTTIQGPVFFLDDSKSAISLNDALMWAKVNRFSPLKTGIIINPF